jgi:hypothetical protein
MKFKLEIDMDNDAFAEEPNYELGRILEKLAEDTHFEARMIPYDRRVMDINGNTVGRATIE